jgi:hypothetical protein
MEAGQVPQGVALKSTRQNEAKVLTQTWNRLAFLQIVLMPFCHCVCSSECENVNNVLQARLPAFHAPTVRLSIC